MKSFFRDHSYNMVKMFLNQFATAIFGFSLCLASGYGGSYLLRNITSVCAILFYMFLLYTMTWEIGFKDRLPGKVRRPYMGLVLSLCANAINFLLAIPIMLATLIKGGVFSAIGGFAAPAALLLQGQYMGVLAHTVDGVPLNSYWFMYFLIPIPAILTCGVAYWMGLSDKKLTSISDHVYPESDREPKKKRWSIHKD